MEILKKYSIMTFNVHNFLNSDMKSSETQIKDLINNYDIVCLQEVYNKKILHKITNGYNYSYNKGTLIITKFHIQEVTKNKKEPFTLLFIDIPYYKRILVINVHLNYQNEDIRTKELSEILENISYTDEFPSILLGDFNALTKNDYSEKEWIEIYKIRKIGKWELPVHTLTDMINDEWNDTGKNNKKKTSRYNTRIDYIYSKNLNILSYDVINMIQGVSDHNLVNIIFN